MKSWRTMFTQQVLNRGRDYFRAGKAKKLTWEADPDDELKAVFSATVRGSRNYKVEIQEDSEEITSMSCTCPYAAEGNYCKHEAAVLYAIEEEYYKLYAPSGDKGKAGTGGNKAEKEQASRNGSAAKDQKEPGWAARASAGPSSGSAADDDVVEEEITYHPSSIPALDKLQQQEAEHRKELAAADPVQMQYRPGVYRYFHPENFENGLHITAAIRRKAEAILKAEDEEPAKKPSSRGRTFGYYLSHPEEDGPLENFKVVTGFPRDDEAGLMMGEASAEISKAYYKTRVVIDFDQNRLVRATCSDWGCGVRTDRQSYLGYALCEHEVALLLKTEAYLKEHNIGDATSSSGRNLLEQMVPMALEQDDAAKAGEENETGAKATQILMLEPHVELSNGNLSAAFYIGNEKLYKIKDLKTFVTAMRQQEMMTFGTKTTLPMGRQYLREGQTQAWYDFIRQTLDETDQREEYFATQGTSYWPQNELKANLPLFGRSLDDFARIAGGASFEFWDKAKTAKEGKKRLTVQDYRPRIQLEVHALGTGGKTSRNGTVEGVEVTGTIPEFLQGGDSLYYIDGSHLNRVSKEESERIAPLTRIADEGKIHVRIGRSHLADFYHKVLPQLRQMADVTEYDTERIAPYIPPEPAFTAYFDTENQSVLCRLETAYGPQLYASTDVIDAIRKDRMVEPAFRDMEAEAHYVNVAMQYVPSYDEALHVLFTQKNDDAIYDLLDHGLAELQSMGEVRLTPSFQALGIRRHVRFSMGVSVESNLMDLTVSSDDLTEDEMYQILYQFQRKRRFVRLKDGTFVKLEHNETIASLLQIMETLQVPLRDFVRGKMHLPMYRALYLDKMLEGTEDLYANRDRHFKELVKEFKTVEDADFEVPQNLQKVLRKYQKDGYRWLRTLDQYGFGGILADEMGLGKTLQVIAVLLAVREERAQNNAAPALPGPAAPSPERAAGGSAAVPAAKRIEQKLLKRADEVTGGKKLPAVSEAAPAQEKAAAGQAAFSGTSLVVCPASLVYNWEEEIHRFAPSLKVGTVAGAAEERHRMIHDYQQWDVLVTSYDLLKRDIAEYEGCSFRFEIIDEAQYIKNAQTAAAKSVKLIRAKTRYALTGTPIENRLSELWSIFDYLMPGFLYDYPRFQANFELSITAGSEETGERLRRMVAPFILRRRKEDVLKDLPEKLEEVRYVGLEGKQLQLYDAQVMKMKADLKDQSEVDFRKGKIEILAELTRIRQLCCDPALIYTNYNGTSAKREALLDMIHTLLDEGHRALIFSQFTSMLELIEQDLDKEGIPYYTITGSTPKARRVDLVRAFNEQKDIRVGKKKEQPIDLFLISLKAGGTGLNLTGADVVIHYDPWWNTAAEDQATDRAHRIGQKKVVTVYKLIARNTIEDRILEMQNRKKDLADQVLSGEGIGSSSISREDLMEILEA